MVPEVVVILFILLLAAFYICPVICPVLDFPAADSSWHLPAPPPSALRALPPPDGESTDVVPAPRRARWNPIVRARPRLPPPELLVESEPESAGKLLRVHENGTIELVDGRSKTILWELATETPVSMQDHFFLSKDAEYFLFPGPGSELHEYINGHLKKHPLTIEEYVAKTPEIRGSAVTIGSKTSTVFVVDADTGEVICKHSLPSNLSVSKVQMGEETQTPLMPKTTSRISHSNGNYITIVRTDYSVSSSSLGTHLWNWTKPFFAAYHHMMYDEGPGAMNDALESSSYSLGSIPVHIGISGKRQDPLALYLNGHVILNDSKPVPVPPTEFGSNFVPLPTKTTDGGLVIPSFGDHLNFINVPSSSFVGSLVLLIPSLLILAIAFLSKQGEPAQLDQSLGSVTHDGQSRDLGGKPSGGTKKRRTRRKDGVNSSDKEYSETDRSRDDSLEKFRLLKDTPHDSAYGRVVGKLFVSNVVIGRGSHGTVVYEGRYGGRTVAVKRLVREQHVVVKKEMENLAASDQHPNIVRLYGVEEDRHFFYIALERCTCSLEDLIQPLSDLSSKNSTSEVGTENHSKRIEKNLDLWRTDGLPSTLLVKLMRDIVYGLAHLHQLGFIHRDLKPQNVLICVEGSTVTAKISDMGISKRLQEGMSSLSDPATGFGTAGWQAPEQLSNKRQTRAVDLFSLGCVLFYCLTKGRHPFGENLERDVNIRDNRYDLFMVDYIPEAVQLISRLLQPDALMRPKAVEVLLDPLFWSSELKLSFLRDVSDMIDKSSDAELLKAVESVGHVAFGAKWDEKLDKQLVDDSNRYRKYNAQLTRDLLRLIRNRSGHYRDLSTEIQELLGTVPDGFYQYFSSRIPKLLIEIYKVVSVYCKEEVCLKKYFRSSVA